VGDVPCNRRAVVLAVVGCCVMSYPGRHLVCRSLFCPPPPQPPQPPTGLFQSPLAVAGVPSSLPYWPPPTAADWLGLPRPGPSPLFGFQHAAAAVGLSIPPPPPPLFPGRLCPAVVTDQLIGSRLGGPPLTVTNDDDDDDIIKTSPGCAASNCHACH